MVENQAVDDKQPGRTEARVTVKASPQRCFDTATDFESYPSWSTDVRKIDVSERDAHGRPSKVEFWAEAFGRSTHYRLVYDYSDAPNRLTWKLEEGDIEKSLVGEYEFHQIDAHSTELVYRLAVELEVSMPGFLRRRVEARIVSAALHQLKARAES